MALSLKVLLSLLAVHVAACKALTTLMDDPAVPGANGSPMSSGQCSFNTPEGLHYDFSGLRKTGGEDYKKIIQVGPNIQFIYRVNLCANTLVNCQNEPAPATEALKIPAGETCRVLGRLAGAKWNMVDAPKSDKNPWGKNMEITYLNGDMCDPAKSTSRSVTLRLAAKKESIFFVASSSLSSTPQL